MTPCMFFPTVCLPFVGWKNFRGWRIGGRREGHDGDDLPYSEVWRAGDGGGRICWWWQGGDAASMGHGRTRGRGGVAGGIKRGLVDICHIVRLTLFASIILFATNLLEHLLDKAGTLLCTGNACTNKWLHKMRKGETIYKLNSHWMSPILHPCEFTQRRRTRIFASSITETSSRQLNCTKLCHQQISPHSGISQCLAGHIVMAQGI